MPKLNLSGMTVEGLMDLRERVEETLHKRRAEKDLVNLHDATVRQGKVAELQRQILDAQQNALTLIRNERR